MDSVCPYCAGGADQSFVTREMMVGLRDAFTYLRCADCRSMWISEVPANLGSYYDDAYYSLRADPKGGGPIPGAEFWVRALLQIPGPAVDLMAGRRGFPRYLRWLSQTGVSLSSKILDVGCGAGNLLLQMSRHGFQNVWGVDPYISDRDAGHARLRAGTINTIAERQFDFVMFNHSLEHVADPVADLGAAAKLLAPNGHILVRIPVADSFADRHYGAHWVSLDPPRHLTVPSRTGIARAASSLQLHISRTFFDSTTMQFTGSEGYAQDVPLREQAASVPSALEKRARALNRTGDGDMGGFLMERKAA